MALAFVRYSVTYSMPWRAEFIDQKASNHGNCIKALVATVIHVHPCQTICKTQFKEPVLMAHIEPLIPITDPMNDSPFPKSLPHIMQQGLSSSVCLYVCLIA